VGAAVAAAAVAEVVAAVEVTAIVLEAGWGQAR